jgi:hypothetical protein
MRQLVALYARHAGTRLALLQSIATRCVERCTWVSSASDSGYMSSTCRQSLISVVLKLTKLFVAKKVKASRGRLEPSRMLCLGPEAYQIGYYQP